MSSVTATNHQNQVNQASGNSTGETERLPKQTLGQDDFLQLLTVQLQNQDPMNPQTDMDFIASMSSFSSVEAITDLSKNFDTFMTDQTKLNKSLTESLGELTKSMSGNEDVQQLLAAQSYLGKEVTIEDKHKGTFKGVVDSVKVFEKHNLDGTDEQVIGLSIKGEIFTLDQVKGVQNKTAAISTMGSAVSAAAQAAAGLL